MAGFIRGKVECELFAGFESGKRATIAQMVFKTLYDYFLTHPNYTVIALNYGATTPQVVGTTAGSGSGTDFWDRPNNFGYNAWFVVRQNATTGRPYDVYHYFQWCGCPNFSAGPLWNAAPAIPSLINGATQPGSNNSTSGVGYACAIGLGGTGGSALSPNNGNPWRGSTNANGVDTKANPVWGPPGGGGTGVIIFPRSNNDPGAHRSSTQNCAGVFNTSFDSPEVRMHVVGDDDSFAIAIDNQDIGIYQLTYSGIYVPRTGLNVQYPYCVVSSWDNLPWVQTLANVYGDIAGTSTRQGGVAQPLTGSSGQLQLDQLGVFAFDTTFWPDASFSPNVYNEFGIPMGIYEPFPRNKSGLLGQIEFVKQMFSVATNGVKSDYSRIFLGTTTFNQAKFSIPWDKVNKTPPRSGASREGKLFAYDPET